MKVHCKILDEFVSLASIVTFGCDCVPRKLGTQTRILMLQYSLSSQIHLEFCKIALSSLVI